MENTEEKKFSYNVFWSGEEISTRYLAQFYENELDQIKSENLLLGNFSAGGKYSFSPETKKALIAIKKRVEEKSNNSYFIVSQSTKSMFSFKMRIFEVDKDFLAANLYLIEVVDDERFSKPLKTFVAQYVDKNNAEFIAKAKYIFNISIEGEFLEREKEENEVILARLLKEDNLDAKLVELVSKTFVIAILKALEKCGEKGKKILEQYNERTVLKEGEKPHSFTFLRKMLENVIEKEGGFEPLIKQSQEIAEAIVDANQRIEEAKRPQRQIEGVPTEKAEKEKKEEKKEPSAPKATKAASKSGGGGGKSTGDKSGGGKKGDSKGGGGGKKKDDKKKEEEKREVFAPIGINVKIKEIDIKAITEALMKKQKAQNTIVKPISKYSKITKTEPLNAKLPVFDEPNQEEFKEEELLENPFLKFKEIRFVDDSQKIELDNNQTGIEVQEKTAEGNVDLNNALTQEEINTQTEGQQIKVEDKIDYEEIIEVLSSSQIKQAEPMNARGKN